MKLGAFTRSVILESAQLRAHVRPGLQRGPGSSETTRESPVLSASGMTSTSPTWGRPGGHVRSKEDEGKGEGGQYAQVAGKYVASFLQTALLVMHVCMCPEEGEEEDTGGREQDDRDGPRRRSRSSPGLPSSESFDDLCRYFGFPRTGEAFFGNDEISNVISRCVQLVSSGNFVCLRIHDRRAVPDWLSKRALNQHVFLSWKRRW